MKRVHKSLLTAAVLLGIGGGAGLYAYFQRIDNREERALEELEAQRLFQFGRDDVTDGKIYARGATVAFARDETWGWKITQPVDTPADPTAITSAIDRMATLRVEEVEDAKSLQDYELERPEAWMELNTKKGAFQLNIGPLNQLDGRRYVSDGKKEKVYLAEANFVWSVDRALEAFREHRLLPIALEKVVRVTMSTPAGQEWEIRRGQTAWEVSDHQGHTLEADAGEINLLLVALTKRLRAETYLDEDVPPSGLPAWTRKFELELTNAMTFGLQLGEYSATAATGNEVPVAWVQGSTTRIEVADWARKDLAKTFDQLRNRTISKFEQPDARRVEWWELDKMIAAVERTGPEAEWTVVGSGKPAAQYLPKGAIVALSRYKADAVEKENPSAEELRVFGLEPARRRFVVRGEQNALLADVRLGRKIGEKEEMYIVDLTRKIVGHTGTRLDDLFPGTPQAVTAN
jgi:hypothetical protein